MFATGTPAEFISDSGRGSVSVWPLRSVLALAGMTYLALLLVSAPQLADPFLRHDDYPALLAAPSGFYEKTLLEGRWLNYWWHLRGFVSPPWLNFAVYQLFWAVFCASAAVLACGRDAPRRYVFLLSLLIMLATPALLISLWFNTLLPGLGLVALYALISTQVSQRLMLWLLFAFVPLTLMAYTTYPLLLFSLCLLRAGQSRSLRNLSVQICLFGASFALGMLTIYSLNWFEHGIFGVPMAEWRNPSPATDLASLMKNLRLAGAAFAKAAQASAFGYTPLALAYGLVLAAVLRVLARHDLLKMLYVLAGFAVGLGLLTLQVVTTGIFLPERATTFAWLLFVAAAVQALILLHRDNAPSQRWLRLVLMVIVMAVVGSYMTQTVKQYYSYSGWQRETRAFADELGSGMEPVYVTGDFLALASARAAYVQEPRGLRLRLYYLTGRWVTDCGEKPEECPEITPYSGARPQIVRQDGFFVLHLPEAPPPA